MQFVFSAAAEMAEYQKINADVIKFKKLVKECHPFALSTNNELMYAPDSAYTQSHRHFSHAMAIHPLGLIKWEDGERSKSIIKNTIRQLDSIGPSNWNGYSYAWLANLKARAKDGEGAAKALQIFSSAFTSVNSFHVNGDQTRSGFSSRTYRPFTLEGNFAAAAGLQEMLLQSYAGFIQIFPAIPASWETVSFTSLRAEGAYLVSAKKVERKIVEVNIISEKGGITKLKLPFKNYRISQARGISVNKLENGFVQLNCEMHGTMTMMSSE